MGNDTRERKIVAQHLSGIERRKSSKIKWPIRMFLRNVGEIKTLPRSTKGRGFITSRPTLQEMKRRKIIPNRNLNLYKKNEEHQK